MSKHLLSAFAKDDPERFAQLLGASSDVEETVSILTDIPDGLEGDVVSRLTAEAADGLLSDLPDPVVVGWLRTCSSDNARRMLARIGLERSASLISGIDDRSKRNELRRLVEYPVGTVGELVQLNVMAIRDSMAVSDIQPEIQRQSGSVDAPVVIIREDGTVSGVLDLVELMKNRDPDARAGNFCIPVKPLFDEASLSSLGNRDEWNRMTSIPVVDYAGRLIGYVSRTRLQDRFAGAGEGSLFFQSANELAKQFLEFMAHVLLLFFTRREPK
jgi:Mg/Co/Ni transporter MgtE